MSRDDDNNGDDERDNADGPPFRRPPPFAQYEDYIRGLDRRFQRSWSGQNVARAGAALLTAIGIVTELERRPGLLRARIESSYDPAHAAIGASVGKSVFRWWR